MCLCKNFEYLNLNKFEYFWRYLWSEERVIFISILSSNEVELQLLVLVPTSHLQEKKKTEKFLSQVSLDGWRPRTWTHNKSQKYRISSSEMEDSVNNVDSAEKRLFRIT